MHLIAPDILAEARGASGALAGTACALGFALWLFGWRWHRFWVVAGVTLGAGLIGLNAGRASGGQVMAVGVLLAVAAGMMALELAKVVAFVAGGVGAWLAVQWVLPQAQELWAVFLSGGLVGLLLYRLWTMLLTSLFGALLTNHAGLLLLGPAVKIIGALGAPFRALSTVVTGARGSLDMFRLGMMGVTQKGAGFANAAGGWVAAVGGIGPATALAGVAVVGFGAILYGWQQNAQNAAKRAAELKAGIASIRGEAESTGKSVDEVFRSTTLVEFFAKGEKGFDRLGINIKEFSKEIAASDDEWNKYVNSIIAANDLNPFESAALRSQLGELRKQLIGARSESKAASEAQGELGVSTDDTADAMGGLATETKSATDALKDHVDAAKQAFDLRQSAADVRQLAFNMLAQGIGAEQLTQFISALNDALTRRIIALNLERHDFSGIAWCWLAFGSEGRDEQTFSTDQDNGIVFACDDFHDREELKLRFLAFAREVNADLDRCGFPLCKGNIMASNPQWCLSLDEWKEQFSKWIRVPQPEALLNATIFFDFRALYGQADLAESLRRHLLDLTASNALFLRAMAHNALDVGPPLGTFRDFVTDLDPDHPGRIDLKKYGARLFVDAARIYALATGVHNTNTVQRLRLAAARQNAKAEEVGAMVEALHFIQLLRLRHQYLEGEPGRQGDNHIDPEQLNELDRRILKESFRQARKLQNRLKLDYQVN